MKKHFKYLVSSELVDILGTELGDINEIPADSLSSEEAQDFSFERVADEADFWLNRWAELKNKIDLKHRSNENKL